MANEELKKLAAFCMDEAIKDSEFWVLSSKSEFFELFKKIGIDFSPDIIKFGTDAFIQGFNLGFIKGRGIDIKVMTEVVQRICKENSNG